MAEILEKVTKNQVKKGKLPGGSQWRVQGKIAGGSFQRGIPEFRAKTAERTAAMVGLRPSVLTKKVAFKGHKKLN